MKASEIKSEDIIVHHPELKNSKILVAVSGGVDSMVLCSILLETGLNFSVAHCNFGLRGNESDEDEKFVSEFCKLNHIEFRVKKFDVEAFRESGNYSVQMAARELRYEWFKQLMEKESFDYLLTAHHLNDSLETFLINLSRGTGTEGLEGIKKVSGYILRPLLSYSKREILEYAQKYNIQWREDASNKEDGYVRNKIRHHITPVLEELHPNFLKNFETTVKRIQNVNELIGSEIQSLKNEIFILKDGGYTISIKKIENLRPLELYLHYLFRDFGFNFPNEIIKLMFSQNSSELCSENYRLIKNRDELILFKKHSVNFIEEYEIKHGICNENPIYLKILTSEVRDANAIESLDAEKISFPLRLRKRKPGDVFTPLGMKGAKKLSKFFKDEKYSKLEKEEAWLLVDKNDKILYLVGKRIDDRYKITNETHNFLNIYQC